MGEARRRHLRPNPGPRVKLRATVFVSESVLAELATRHPTEKALYIYLGHPEHVAPDERQAWLTLEVPIG